MPSFGERSMRHYNTLHPDLQLVLSEAIKYVDFSIICGHRDKQEQNLAFQQGRSKLRFPQSKHNSYPSDAVDIVPYPNLDWNDRERFTYIAGIIMGIAMAKGIPLRWGGDWDRDGQLKDNSFDDLPHLERWDGR